MNRTLIRRPLRLLLLLVAFASQAACVVDSHGRIHTPFHFAPAHAHHHCR